MECKHLTPRFELIQEEIGQPPAKPTPKKRIDINSLQESMRISMMEGTSNLMNKFFDSLNTMESDETFVRTMLQLFKFSIPTFKSLEVKEKPDQTIDEDFFLKYNLGID